jgi:Tfp pilus assembly protein PilF
MNDEHGTRALVHRSSLIVHRFFFTLLLIVGCARREAPKPNVLLITLDTFRADRIGPLTPNLDRLGREAVRFENAVAPAPMTLPAHGTILSGLLPLHHTVRINGAGSFPTNRETLATLFARNGYRTAAFVGAFVLDHRFGLQRGFEVYDDAIERDPNDATSSLEAERRGNAVVDSALNWLRRPDQRPFLAWVHLYDAHAPYAPPSPYPQTYDGEVAFVDAQVGRLLSAIDRGNTIVAVVGDHGESLGEHDELTHGLLIFEPTLHVPMIIAAPGLPAHLVRQPVGSVDLAATVAALAHLAMPAGDGRDLSDDLRRGRDPKEHDLYSETRYPLQFGWSDLAAVRRGGLKLIAGPSSKLFDVSRDPGETRDLSTSERRAYHELQSMVERIRSTAAASPTGTVDPETRSKLASLGYIAPSGAAGQSSRDPVAMAPLFAGFERAMLALNLRRPAVALPLLENLVASDPANPLFRSALARAYREVGNLRRAIDLYRQAVALAPDDADAWYNLAAALEDGGAMREARAALEEVLKREPGRPEAHNALGVAYASEGNSDAAAAEFRRAIELDPRNARAYNNLGNLFRSMQRMDDAATAYRKAIELSPRYADALNGLGAVLVQQGRPQEALAAFDAALRVAPDFYEAQLNRGIALQIAGDREGARRQWQQLLARIPPGRAFDPQRAAARNLLSQK